MIKRPRLLAANHSGYPTDLPTGPDPETRRRAIQWVVEAQVRAGLDIVTDGQVGYVNPLVPLVAGLSGLEPGREQVHVAAWGNVAAPAVTGPIEWTRPLFEEDLILAQDVAGRPVKISMAGPYSLASLARDSRGIYDSFGGRIEACARALACEVQALSEHGASVIQIEEPVILTRLTDFPRLREGLLPLDEARGPSPIELMLSGDSICPLYDWLQNLPVNILGLDLIHSPRLISMVGDRETSHSLGLGIFDPEAVALEGAETIFPALDQMLAGVSGGEVHVQPAATLAGLSPEMAHSKLANLAALVREFNGRGAAVL
jgi:5-methyltetrahydropteroyltriglutamate--homocysteine methyltransferase